MEIDETNTEKTRKRVKIDIDALSESSDSESSVVSNRSTYHLRSGDKVCRKKYKAAPSSDDNKAESVENTQTDLSIPKTVESKQKLQPSKTNLSTVQPKATANKTSSQCVVPTIGNPGTQFVLSPYVINPFMNYPFIVNNLPIQNLAGLGNNIAIVGGNLPKVANVAPVVSGNTQEVSKSNLNAPSTTNSSTNEIAVTAATGKIRPKKAAIDNKRFVSYSPGLNIVSGLRLPSFGANIVNQNIAIVQTSDNNVIASIASTVPSKEESTLKIHKNKEADSKLPEKDVDIEEIEDVVKKSNVDMGGKRKHTLLSQIIKGDDELKEELAVSVKPRRGRKKKALHTVKTDKLAAAAAQKSSATETASDIADNESDTEIIIPKLAPSQIESVSINDLVKQEMSQNKLFATSTPMSVKQDPLKEKFLRKFPAPITPVVILEDLVRSSVKVSTSLMDNRIEEIADQEDEEEKELNDDELENDVDMKEYSSNNPSVQSPTIKLPSASMFKLSNEISSSNIQSFQEAVKPIPPVTENQIIQKEASLKSEPKNIQITSSIVSPVQHQQVMQTVNPITIPQVVQIQNAMASGIIVANAPRSIRRQSAETIIIEELKNAVAAKDKEIENLKKILMDRKVLPPSQQRMFPNPLDLKNIEIASLKNELSEVMKNNTQLSVKLEKLQQVPPTIAVPPPISNAPTQDDGPSTTKYFTFDIPEINYKLNDNLNNIDVYIEEHTEFVKVKIEDGFQLYCSVCRKQGKNNNRSQLAKGINYTGDKAYNLENGRSRDWYKMKDTLKTHLEAHKFDKIKCNAAENILAVALTSVKTRCSTTDFVSWLSMLKALGVEIGNSCHGHAHFNKMVVELRAHAVQILIKHLKTPLVPTGFEPHFSVAMDWFKFNKETNLAIFLVINIDGERRAVPIDVQVVSSDVIGDENVAEHADIMFRVLKTHLTLEDDDFHRMTSVFTSKPNPILYQYVRNKLNMVNDKFFFNFIDDSDWIDSTAKKVLQFMKFFKLFNKRCVRFQSVFKFDKKKESKKDEVKDTNEVEITTPLKSKYCSVLLKELKSHFKSYYSIFASMADETQFDEKFQEVLYFVRGRDFIMDLCVLIDILTPVTEVIVMTQTENIPPWKVTIWLPRLFRVLKDMEDNLRLCHVKGDVPSGHLFPYLNPNWEGIVEEKKIFDDWISTQTIFKRKDPKYLWGTRSLNVCIGEYVAFCSELRQQLFSMYQTCVEDSIKELRSCFDLECMFDEIVDAEDCSSEVKDKHMENFYLRGFKEFQGFLSFLEKKPQISAGINPMLSYDLFRTWKELFCDLIYKNSHTKGTWFYSKTGERLLLSDEIEKIKFESEEGITKTFYEITLKNNSVISGVRFLEEEFMKFLTQNNDHLSQVDKTLHAVLNYVFSFYLTERNFGQIFFSMKFHEKEGTLTHPKLIDRCIVDCLYPSALQCRSTITNIARSMTESGKLFPVTVRKKKKQDSIFSTFSAATVRYPFLLEKADSEKQDDSNLN